MFKFNKLANFFGTVLLAVDPVEVVDGVPKLQQDLFLALQVSLLDQIGVWSGIVMNEQ